LVSHPWGNRISASVFFKAWSITHKRHILCSANGWLLVIDNICAKDATLFTQWSHFAPEIHHFTPSSDGYNVELPSNRQLAVRVLTSSPKAEIKLIRGQTQPQVQGWISRGYMSIEPSTAMGISQEGTNIIFATLYAIDDEGCTLARGP